MKFTDLTGQTFERWTVQSFHHRSEFGQAYWLCECACGTIKPVLGSSLRSGGSKSCGCRVVDYMREISTIHGMNNTPEQSSWIHLSRRCLNPSDWAFQDYGGRGITVCHRYQYSFQAFYTDVGPRPSSKHSIDRIDNNGHYSCGKCDDCRAHGWTMNIRWATMSQQHRNRRGNHLLTHNGVTMCLVEWHERATIDISYQTFYRRISTNGWTIHRALTTPVEKRSHNAT
jgi:hypothetical protein